MPKATNVSKMSFSKIRRLQKKRQRQSKSIDLVSIVESKKIHISTKNRPTTPIERRRLGKLEKYKKANLLEKLKIEIQLEDVLNPGLREFHQIDVYSDNY